jgi:hypothetical protein
VGGRAKRSAWLATVGFHVQGYQGYLFPSFLFSSWVLQLPVSSSQAINQQ